ncbi:MAG: hypothetical protein ACE5EC_10620, partial [Phycisphaerae bacterium]
MFHTFIRVVSLICLSGIVLMTGCARQPTEAEMQLTTLHDEYLAAYRPLLIEKEKAWWDASTTGDDAAFQRQADAEKALVRLHGDRETFAKLKALKEGGEVRDPVLKRQLEV